MRVKEKTRDKIMNLKKPSESIDQLLDRIIPETDTVEIARAFSAEAAEVLSVKNRIDVEGSEWMRVIYKRLRAAAESLNGRVKKRIAYSQFTWQGMENASIHVGLVLMWLTLCASPLTGLGGLSYGNPWPSSREVGLGVAGWARGCHSSRGVEEGFHGA